MLIYGLIVSTLVIVSMITWLINRVDRLERRVDDLERELLLHRHE